MSGTITDELLKRYPLLATSIHENLIEAYQFMKESFEKGGKVLIAGNGGSAADAAHIVGELMKSFKFARPCCDDLRKRLMDVQPVYGEYIANHIQGALPAMSLCEQVALNTAFSNDSEPALCYAQQINGYGRAGDVFLGISTSGNSSNIVYAAVAAKAKGMKVIGLTGKNDSKLSGLADVCIKAPATETYLVQEYHLPIYHCLCSMLEEHFFSN